MVNPYRNCEELYDVLSAFQLIRSVGAEVGKYDFFEAILESDFLFSPFALPSTSVSHWSS